jgi:hypothetical protein
VIRPFVVLAVLSIASLASADVVPEGYVERCTLAAMSADHAGCEECRTGFSAPDACATAHASDGRVQACRSGGASVWTEVWCQPGTVEPTPPPSSVVPATPPPSAAPAPTSAPVEERSGCAVSHAGGGEGASIVIGVLAILVVTTRRGRRSHG